MENYGIPPNYICEHGKISEAKKPTQQIHVNA